jgi:hypothetical protein
MKNCCRGLFLDLDRMVHDKCVRIGGVWPDQWIAICVPPPRRKPNVLPPLPPPAPAPPEIYVDDEEAMRAAIEQSLADMKLQPQCDTPCSTRHQMTRFHRLFLAQGMHRLVRVVAVVAAEGVAAAVAARVVGLLSPIGEWLLHTMTQISLPHAKLPTRAKLNNALYVTTPNARLRLCRVDTFAFVRAAKGSFAAPRHRLVRCVV